MLRLALHSLRFRSGAFVATFLAMFLGATIVMTFASLLDTSGGARVDAATEETLFTMASVVGGWSVLIVSFAAASTLTLSVRQRGREMALLRSVGATPGQIRRLIVGEAAAVALAGWLAAIPGSILAGGLLVELLKDNGQVASGVSHAFGPIAIQTGLGITLLSAIIGAAVAARRLARMQAGAALTAAAVDGGRMGRARLVAGWLFLVAGVSNGVVTATVFHGKGIDAMATGGQAAILTSIALALFAPALMRAATALVAGPFERRGGVAGYLTVLNIRQRTQSMAGALVPVILFTGIATGTLYMQSIENAAPFAAGGSITAAEAANIETLNFVVVGMIAVFAAIMLVTTLVAATTHRRREFGQQRLVGSTPSQVLGMVSLEGVALAGTGVLFGSLAALVSVIPYSIARTDSILPDSTIATYLGIVAVAATLTLASSVGAARRAIRTPAVEAAAA